jgi:hypothetical protein
MFPNLDMETWVDDGLDGDSGARTRKIDCSFGVCSSQAATHASNAFGGVSVLSGPATLMIDAHNGLWQAGLSVAPLLG